MNFDIFDTLDKCIFVKSQLIIEDFSLTKNDNIAF